MRLSTTNYLDNGEKLSVQEGKQRNYNCCYAKEECREKEGYETIDIDLKPLKSVEARAGSLDLSVKYKLYVSSTQESPEFLVLWYRDYIMKVFHKREIAHTKRLMFLFQNTKNVTKKIVLRAICETGRDIDQHRW